jgi:hypothetical protein
MRTPAPEPAPHLEITQSSIVPEIVEPELLVHLVKLEPHEREALARVYARWADQLRRSAAMERGDMPPEASN